MTARQPSAIVALNNAAAPRPVPLAGALVRVVAFGLVSGGSRSAWRVRGTISSSPSTTNAAGGVRTLCPSAPELRSQMD